MRIKLGDIFEINTPKGKAYLHYIYKDSTLGDLIRVLPELYSERPVNFDMLAITKERYVVFFSLTTSYKQKILEKVGHYICKFEKPKYMRTEHIIKNEFLGWHIIDTDSWKRQLVKTLKYKELELSPWGIWSDTLLIERLINDWSLIKWS